ncbi:MAG: O-antigen/teichoic acid export membrane protein [Moritella sp.]|jgi:O-antigen/teichoic acid export membrane protein
MVKGKVIHQAVYYGLGILLMKSVSLVMLPIVTFYLTPAQYGALELLLSVSNFATIIVGFGLVDALYRFVGLNEDPQQERTITANFITLAIVIGVVSVVLGLFFSPVIVTFLTAETTLLDVQLLVVMFSLEGCITIPLAWLRMKEQAFLFFILTTAKVVIQAFITWYLLSQGFGMTAILWGGLISIALLAAVLLLIQIRETGLYLNLELTKKILSYGFPLVLSGFAAFSVNGADWWMIAAVSTEHDLGLYSLAKKIAFISLILMQPFSMWWYARRFKILKQFDGINYIAKMSSFGMALILCFATLIYLSSGIMITYLIDPSYQQAIIYIPGLLLFCIIKQIAELVNLGCYIEKKTWSVMYIDFTTAVVAFSACYLISGYYQVFGVVLGLVIAQTFRALAFYVISQKVLKLHYMWKPLLWLALACIGLVTLMAITVTFYHQVLIICLSLFVFSCFFYINGFIGNNQQLNNIIATAQFKLKLFNK